MNVQDFLLHRYPFLLIDNILERTETRCVTLKNLSHNEEFFQGHFIDGIIKIRKPDGTEKTCAAGTIKCAKVKQQS